MANAYRQADAVEKNAALWFGKAMTAYNEQLQLLAGHSGGVQEISAATLRKAEVQMTTKDYEGAIVTLTTLVTQEPDKPIPLLNRAFSELQLNRLDSAKNDFLAVEKMESQPCWQCIPASPRSPQAKRQIRRNSLRQAIPQVRLPYCSRFYQRHSATPCVGGQRETSVLITRSKISDCELPRIRDVAQGDAVTGVFNRAIQPALTRYQSMIIVCN